MRQNFLQCLVLPQHAQTLSVASRSARRSLRHPVRRVDPDCDSSLVRPEQCFPGTVDDFRPLPIFSPLLVRWLSGRKQRFAKAPYSKRVPRVRIPPSPLISLLLSSCTFTYAHSKKGMESGSCAGMCKINPGNALLISLLLFLLTSCGAIRQEWGRGIAAREEKARQDAIRTAAAAPHPKPSVWDPDSGEGPAKIVINLTEQRAYFYKGETVVGESNISSGKKGYETPP